MAAQPVTAPNVRAPVSTASNQLTVGCTRCPGSARHVGVSWWGSNRDDTGLKVASQGADTRQQRLVAIPGDRLLPLLTSIVDGASLSELSAVACYGPARRNTGAPKSLDLVGELLVGGSGLWIFRQQTGERTEVRMRSNAAFADEVKAGFALSGLYAEVTPDVERLLGVDWPQREVDVQPSVVRQLAELVVDVPVAVVLTELGSGQSSYDPAAWENTSWSVTVTVPAERRLLTQWS
ncbi:MULTISPECIES: hypothetical protein [unclassified Modestobacter]|uniref:hypothetical protein n=1 Tax=unclassified Modestobacter TaxID=2643866 RepID=UPI0022AA6796|nr:MULTISPECIES: hypothetical protein [unclassified Modestobacter]MCZ2826040.1 hypothetical protein [Modestobacter sp. VKM Ac-2981]MCZ2852895.1 hypothetical protein [Modestobacter sp. VKM Ac-2982]